MRILLPLSLALATGACTSAAPGHDFDPCLDGGDCEPGLYCDPTSRCMRAQPGLLNGSCGTDVACADGLACDDAHRVCVPATDCKTQACDPTFSCESDNDVVFLCRTPAASRKPCVETTPHEGVPLQTKESTSGPLLLHWSDPARCVTVTYDPALAAKASAIETALQAWDAVACSKLCFAAPTAHATAPRPMLGERRLHFAVGALPANAQLGRTDVTYEPTTGKIVNVLVTLPSADKVVPLDLLTHVGTACGLGHPSRRPASVMVNPTDERADHLTVADEAAICALYGEPLACAD